MSKELHRTKDVYIQTILSACTKSSNINIFRLQLSNIAFVTTRLGEIFCLIMIETTHILTTRTMILVVDAQVMLFTSSHLVTLLFKTPSSDLPLWSDVLLTAPWLVVFQLNSMQWRRMFFVASFASSTLITVPRNMGFGYWFKASIT